MLEILEQKSERHGKIPTYSRSRDLDNLPSIFREMKD